VASRVFVTGGSGLIGRALVGRLVERGADVVAVARSDTADRALTAAGAVVARGDLLDAEALEAAMRGCGTVYNVAGVNTLCPDDREDLFRVNVHGASTVARAAARAGVERLVHTSSAATLGEHGGTVGREDSAHRGWFLSAYEQSKLAGERAVFEAGRGSGLDVVCVNPSSVQGPGRTGGTGRIVLALLDGRLKVFVNTRISLIDIDDCVEGHLLAADRGRPGERYVLSGATLSSDEAFGLIRSISGGNERPRLLPGPLATSLALAVEGAFRLVGRTPPVCREMVRTMLHGHAYDGSKAERELGLRYTPVAETLRRTAAWAVEEGLVRRPLPGLRGPGGV
jgi:dihydroflavonol-4-reductase